MQNFMEKPSPELVNINKTISFSVGIIIFQIRDKIFYPQDSVAIQEDIWKRAMLGTREK